MTSEAISGIALVWRGDLETRLQATPGNNRWRDIFAALVVLNIDVKPAVYCEEAADEVCEQLLEVDGVLVWVDPLSGGRDRRKLDALLRDVATQGVWVSTHPDVMQKKASRKCFTRRGIWAGAPTRISIAAPGGGCDCHCQCRGWIGSTLPRCGFCADRHRGSR